MESINKTRHKKPPKLEDMSKEQIRKTIMKKRETSTRAQGIVESLLIPGVKEDTFLMCLPHINQSHLEDVAEERAIAHICGYPPCRNELTSTDIPKQQYRICVKTNKVYDITVRKNFCSNKCYKAMMYIKQQMLTGPLWFREYEEIPEFHLMLTDVALSMGQEVDLCIVEKIKVNQDFITSINDFASASFSELGNDIKTLPEDSSPATQHRESGLCLITEEYKHNSGAHPSVRSTGEKMISQNEKVFDDSKLQNVHTVNQFEEANEQSIGPRDSHIKLASREMKVPNYKKNSPSIIGEVVERPEKKIDPIITSVKEQNKSSKPTTTKKTTQHKHDSIATVIIHVEKCIAEWFTLDSMIFLFGEAKVKEMVADKGDSIKEYLTKMANGLLYSSASYDQYQQLCRKLNMLELEDHRYNSNIVSRETKPLPHYSILKEEGKRIELKVKAFLSGECDIIPEMRSAVEDKQEEDQSNLTQLALVDKNAQMALRRKILLTNLNRVLQDLQRSLGLQGTSIASDVRLLFNSFKLKAHNIMFKPIEWTLIGVVVIKLLSLRDVRIQYALEFGKTDQNLQLLLLSYKQDGGYLDRLVLWLTDIDRLLDINNTQLTGCNQIK